MPASAPTLDSQLDQLRAAGCSSRNIYREKVTGARADRRELNRMLGKLAHGDVLTVTRLDRLARSTFDLFGTETAVDRPKEHVGRPIEDQDVEKMRQQLSWAGSAAASARWW
jgi:Resolvase, N terminal domain